MEVILRKAESKDCKDLFDWRCDPITIQFSPGDVPSYYEHKVWFSRSLKNPLRQILIIEILYSSNSLGMVRFDFKNVQGEIKKVATISININPLFRRKGVGLQALLSALDYAKYELKIDKIEAEIMISNKASVRLFEKCGFLQIKESGDSKEDLLLYVHEF